MRTLSPASALLLVPALALGLLVAAAPHAAVAQDSDAQLPVVLHGSFQASLYTFDDTSESDRDYSRPSLRANIKATNLFGGHYSLKVRARTRYDDRARKVGNVPQTEWRSRFYEASLAYDNPDSPFAFVVGRIVARDMGGVGYTDGAMLTHRPGENWRWGVLAGTRPDWETSALSTDITKYGAFVGFERGDRATSRFEASVAAVGEYHESTVSREFLHVRTNYAHGQRLNLYGTAEIDINRDWREDRTGESASLSTLFLRGRYRVSEDVTVGLGYDTRKNYLTYEARSIPDSLFIDAARHGVRASADVKMPAEVRLHAEVGTRGIEDSGEDATVFYSAQFTRRDLLWKRLTGSARLSGFQSPYALGTQVRLRLRRSFKGGHSVHLGYGTYSYGIDDADVDRLNQWVRMGGTAQLPARLYLSGEFTSDWGDDSEGLRLLAEVGYRF